VSSKPRARVLITGGAGFLGSHLCERFLAEGYEVICMDNLITGDITNVEHLFQDRWFHFEQRDVTEYIHVVGALDAILHFASPASPIDYLELPIQTLKVGSLGTHKVLGLARAKGARFLLASTSECYGDPLVHPQAESYWGNVNPVGPRGVYDEAKRFAEAMTMAYHRFHGLDTRIVRIFNTYGPRMRLRDGRALPAFMSQALSNQPLTVFGDGSQTRSFCYVDDLVEGIWRTLGSRENLPINLGNPDEMTILEFAEAVLELTGSRSSIVFKELPVDDPRVRQPDITKARKLLGWEPKVALREGLARTLSYFKSRVAGNAPPRVADSTGSAPPRVADPTGSAPPRVADSTGSAPPRVADPAGSVLPRAADPAGSPPPRAVDPARLEGRAP
jgi:dTDP-glucose 4,6-dehydratase